MTKNVKGAQDKAAAHRVFSPEVTDPPRRSMQRLARPDQPAWRKEGFGWNTTNQKPNIKTSAESSTPVHQKKSLLPQNILHMLQNGKASLLIKEVENGESYDHVLIFTFSQGFEPRTSTGRPIPKLRYTLDNFATAYTSSGAEAKYGPLDNTISKEFIRYADQEYLSFDLEDADSSDQKLYRAMLQTEESPLDGPSSTLNSDLLVSTD